MICTLNTFDSKFIYFFFKNSYIYTNINLSKVTVIPYAFASVFRQLEAVRALEERTGKKSKLKIENFIYIWILKHIYWNFLEGRTGYQNQNITFLVVNIL